MRHKPLPKNWRAEVSSQPEGAFVRPLRKGKRLTWVRVCAVPMDEKGYDQLGRYHGRNGVALYAIEFPDSTFQYFRSRVPAVELLKRKYPKAVIEISDVRGLSWAKRNSPESLLARVR